MQHLIVTRNHPYGLPLDLKLLPQLMQDAGYITALIGKVKRNPSQQS